MNREKELLGITFWGSVGNFMLLVFKFAAGILGRSSAMIADAIHSLSDFVTDIVVYIFINISSKPNDKNHNYGYGKYETLATLIIGVILASVGLGMLWDGGSKIYGFYFRNEVLQSPGTIAFIAALVSIFVKEILYHMTISVGRRHKCQTVIANAWHHRSDAFSSIGTALGIGGAIWLGDDWVILDPLAAMIVSVFILKVASNLIIPAVNELLEHSLPEEMEKEILSIIRDVHEPHNLYTRRIGSNFAIEAHLRMAGNSTIAEAHQLTLEIEQNLHSKYGKDIHVTLRFEPLE